MVTRAVLRSTGRHSNWASLTLVGSPWGGGESPHSEAHRVLLLWAQRRGHTWRRGPFVYPSCHHTHCAENTAKSRQYNTRAPTTIVFPTSANDCSTELYPEKCRRLFIEGCTSLSPRGRYFDEFGHHSHAYGFLPSLHIYMLISIIKHSIRSFQAPLVE